MAWEFATKWYVWLGIALAVWVLGRLLRPRSDITWPKLDSNLKWGDPGSEESLSNVYEYVVGFGGSTVSWYRGFKFSYDNTRLIHRAIAWAAGDEKGYAPWTCSNVRTECACFPRGGKLVVINNAGEPQTTTVTLGDGRTKKRVKLAAHGIRILDV
jgi:hypothetical protein